MSVIAEPAARPVTRAPRPVPQVLTHQVVGAAHEQALGRMDRDHRSQKDRDHVPGHDVRVLHARRRRGAADAGPAGRAEQHAAERRALQRAADAPRDHDGVPVRGAGDGGVRQLLRAADDRRAGHGVPAAERALLLAAARRRDRVLRDALLPPARGGLVELPAAVEHPVLAERRPGRVDLPDPPDRHLLAAGRDQLLRDDREHARPGDDLGPSAAVHLDDPRVRDPPDHRAPGGGGGRDDAADRPALRDPLVRPDRARVADPVAAPVLVLRPPRGLHHGPAGLRDHLRGHPGVLAQADLRLQGDRRVDRRDRVPGHARVGPPHVRLADPGRRARVLHAELVPDRGPDRGQDLQLDLDPVARIDRDDDLAVLRGRDDRDLHRRRDHRHLPGRVPGRLAAQRHLLRRRPLPLHDLRRRDLPGARRDLLLVPEDDRYGC